MIEANISGALTLKMTHLTAPDQQRRTVLATP